MTVNVGVDSAVRVVSEHWLAEIATPAAVTPRTVRYYQATDLLPQPTRRGSHVVFADAHLRRLHAIAQLQEQGLRLATIRRMLDGHHVDHDNVVALLGPGLGGSAWLAASTRTLTDSELADMLGDAYRSWSATWRVPGTSTFAVSEDSHATGSPRASPAQQGRYARRDRDRRRTQRCGQRRPRAPFAPTGRRSGQDLDRRIGSALLRGRHPRRPNPQPRTHPLRAWPSAAQVMAVEMERAIRNAAVIGERVDHRPATRLRTTAHRVGGPRPR